MRDALVVLRIALVRLGFGVGSLLPLRRRMVLATSHARQIGGNLGAIREAMAALRPAMQVTVLASAPAASPRAKLASALQAVLAGYHLARARLFVVDDYFFPIYAIRPRRGTTIVQTWHASGAFKKMGYSLAGKTFGADAALLRRVRIHANYDLCLISTTRVLPHYIDAFRLPATRFTSRIGIPRTDLFFQPDVDRRAAAVRQRYAIPADRQVVLYAPTFRGDSVADARHSDELDLATLHQALDGTHVVLLRLHPFVRARAALPPALRQFVIDVSDHPDINELMLASDVLITDYSSSIYDFALLERPIAFFAPDHAAYERERGFYLDYDRDLPGPIFDSTPALAAWLRAGAFDVERVRRFRDASFDVADGQAARRFVEQVAIPSLTGSPVAVPVLDASERGATDASS